MSAQPGCKKNGGRKKGTPNKDTLDLVKALNDAGYSPIADLIFVSEQAKKEYERCDEIYDAIQDTKKKNGITTPTQDMAPVYLGLIEKTAADIMPYLFPKRKSVEIKDPDGTVKSLADLMREVVGLK